MSTMVANIFMEKFEGKALSIYPAPPKFLGRHVDDVATYLYTFLVLAPKPMVHMGGFFLLCSFLYNLRSKHGFECGYRTLSLSSSYLHMKNNGRSNIVEQGNTHNY